MNTGPSKQTWPAGKAALRCRQRSVLSVLFGLHTPRGPSDGVVSTDLVLPCRSLVCAVPGSELKMAGIAGIYSVDGRPADGSDLQRMADALAHRGPDGTSNWRCGPIGFAHLQLCTTPESLHEHQPLQAPWAEACLVWDGRLDNREELSEAIVSRGGRLVDDT